MYSILHIFIFRTRRTWPRRPPIWPLMRKHSLLSQCQKKQWPLGLCRLRCLGQFKSSDQWFLDLLTKTQISTAAWWRRSRQAEAETGSRRWDELSIKCRERCIDDNKSAIIMPTGTKLRRIISPSTSNGNTIFLKRRERQQCIDSLLFIWLLDNQHRSQQHEESLLCGGGEWEICSSGCH